MWFKVEDAALDDERIEFVAMRLGITHGDAFLALCRVWRRLYRKGGGFMTAPEVDTAGRVPGLADALVAECLAELEGEDLLRIKGDDRATKYGQFLLLQREKSEKARTLRSGALVLAHTQAVPSGLPPENPPGHPGEVPIYTLSGSDLSQSSQTSQLNLVGPDSARASQLRKATQALDAAGSWVEWFNRRFNRSFTVTKELAKTVAALLARGYSEKPDMRGVALYLRSRWEDDERMAPHLVPSTILRPTKFPERLDLAREWDRESGGNIWQVQS